MTIRPGPPDPLTVLCQNLLAGLGRSGRRRWAEVYVRGLLSDAADRKSVQRIAREVLGGEGALALQQFLHQSPWPWQPVRRRLAEHLRDTLRPRAWVVAEAVFPKKGSETVGVARQYAPSARRMLNCQLALGLFLVGARGCGPVDWRLQLPGEWIRDLERRRRARVPDGEFQRSRAGYILDMVDTMADVAPSAPIVVDARAGVPLEPLLDGLERGGRRYLVRVGPRATIRPSEVETVGRLAANLPAAPGGFPAVPRFVPLNGHVPVGGRQLVAEWTPGAPRPRAFWLTSAGGGDPVPVPALVGAPVAVRAELAMLRDRLGLDHFEGRSFIGWHHHVTLVSVAAATKSTSNSAVGEVGEPIPAR